jgi:ABC-2 type transport system ATP-binding protein
MASAEAVIETAHLTKWYGRRRGIEDVTFTVSPGEIFGFLGPNGAGKTTTIRCLLGFVRPQHGESRLFGRSVQRIDRARLGVVPGELSLFERMTGAQLLDYLAGLTGRRPVERADLLARFALGAADLVKPIRQYSRGMKQKLGIVQALQHSPELLILDEPTEGLDPLMQQQFYLLLGELRARGRTVFLSSHLLWEVERTCDRVAIIRNGQLAALDRIDTLRARSIRRVEVHFAEPAEVGRFAPPGGVVVEDVHGARATLRVPVPQVGPTLAALAARRVLDLIWERPSLEDVFLGYYREAPDGR